jgi:hypothetical protein
MKISTLIIKLFGIYLKHGDLQIDMVIEDYDQQSEAELGEVASVIFKDKHRSRVKLLSKDFT